MPCGLRIADVRHCAHGGNSIRITGENEMKPLLFIMSILMMPVGSQRYKIAVVWLVHSHVWGHLPKMAKGDLVKLVAIAEPNQELVAEAKKAGANVPYYDDYNKMLDEQKPDIVWAFVE